MHIGINSSACKVKYFSMEIAVSAVAGELLSRFISFLIEKQTNRPCLAEKLEQLQRLLLRIHTVVEEAEGRYITNAVMLSRLNMLVNGMYRGYCLLDTIKYSRPPEDISCQQGRQVSRSCSLASPLKRFRKALDRNDDLQSVLGELETCVANMAEFVILVAGCDRMYRTPYDHYFYIDNFMFGRTVEKQQIINFLLQDVSPTGAPAVLPIIGGCLVGKKTLVGHACRDTRVLSHFSSIFHLDTQNMWRKDQEQLMFIQQPGRILVVAELLSDVDDDCWEHFYSSMASKCRGSKVVILSRLESTARFGTVKPIRLKTLTHEEYVYLFKVLSFGSANPDDHPRLASIGMEIATLLHGLLITANVVAYMLRTNFNAQYWLHILRRFRNVIEDNLSALDAHPKRLMEKDHPVDITKFLSPYRDHTRLHFMPPRGEISVGERELSNVTFGELVAGSTASLPKGDFEIVVWESRLPPYTKFVSTCATQKPPSTSSSSKKRRGFQM